MSEAKSWITGNAMVAHPKVDRLTKNYLYYALLGSNLNSTITGSAQPQITRQSLSPFQIPLPPLAEQQRIVAELEEERRLVAANTALVARMEARIKERVARVWGGGSDDRTIRRSDDLKNESEPKPVGTLNPDRDEEVAMAAEPKPRKR